MEKMNISEKNNLTTKIHMPDRRYSHIVTREHVLKKYEEIFNKIDKLWDKSDNKIKLAVGSRIQDGYQIEIFYLPGWGFISFNDLMECEFLDLEKILENLYTPQKICDNLIPILERFSRINVRRINELNSELGFLKSLYT